MLLRNKWAYVQKDPERSLRNESMDMISYWQQLNNLPRKAVNNIVNDKIIKLDKKACA